MARPDVDPIGTAVFERRLGLVAQEMALSLLRSTRSPVFHQARDFATGVFTPRGEIMHQAEYLPLLGLALQHGLRSVIDRLGDAIEEGDVVFHNDVFGGGNQLSDVAVFAPVFVSGELVGWVGCKGHQADIGGAVQGGVNPAATEVWQEGLRIPPVRVQRAGVFLSDVWELVCANVRNAEVVGHDLRAQIGSCLVGVRSAARLVAAYGPDEYRRRVGELFTATERRTRDLIAGIPDGTYAGASLKSPSHSGRARLGPVRVAVTVTVAGDEMTFDFSGSAAQTASYVNAPYAATASAVLLTFRLLCGQDVTLNEGMLGPLRLVVPEGSVLNPAFPAATAYGNHLTDQVSEAIFRALAPALPERVSAGWNPLYGSYVNGVDSRSGEPYHDVLFLANKGGGGAVRGADGFDHIGTIEGCGSIRAQDYEAFELHNDITVLEHEYLTDSAGPGRWRGGLGVRTVLRFEGQGSQVVLYGDGLAEGAFGLFGGMRGCPNSAEVVRPDGVRRAAESDDLIADIPRGSLLRKVAGGGGGHGRPADRDPSAVRADVENGFVSAKAAADVYGWSPEGSRNGTG